jgi:hypothetical protein
MNLLLSESPKESKILLTLEGVVVIVDDGRLWMLCCVVLSYVSSKRANNWVVRCGTVVVPRFVLEILQCCGVILWTMDMVAVGRDPLGSRQR